MNKILTHITRLICVGIMAFAITITSCTNKAQSVINEMEDIVEIVEKKELSKEDLTKAIEKHEVVAKKYEECCDQMTEEQRKTWGKLQARYLKAIAAEGIKGFGDTVKGMFDSFSGFIEEMSKTDKDGKSKLNDVIGDLGKNFSDIDTTTINQLMQGLSTVGQKMVESAAKEFENGETLEKLKESLNKEDLNKLMENVGAQQLKQMAGSMNEEDLKRMIGSVSDEDIKKLKESITADDIKKIKEAFSKEEIEKMKKMLENASK